MIFKNKKSQLPGVICLGVCIATLVVGLWPFFWPKNEVMWLPGKNGICFYGLGIVYTPDPLNDFAQDLSQNKSVSIEIWLQPKVEPVRHLNHLHSAFWHDARILSFYDVNKEIEQLTFTQSKTNLIIRSKLFDSKSNKSYKKIVLSNSLTFGKTQLITVSTDVKGTVIYLDGRLAKFYPNHTLIAKNNKMFSQLLLGNSPNGKQPWAGNLFGLAFYNRSLTAEEVKKHYQSWLEDGNPTPSTEENLAALYLFNEHNSTFAHDSSGHQYNLLIPKTFQELQKKTIGQWEEFSLKKFHRRDIFVNILGFIPLGFVLSIYLYSFKSPSWQRIYLITILIGVGISLTIELLQIYIPTRDPSLTDVTCNIFGTVLGVILLNFIHIFKKTN